MPTFFYTGRLTDIGVHVLTPDYVPRLTVRPEEEAFGPDGIVSEQRVVVSTSGSGAFSMELVPSHQLTGASGASGVKYVIELALFSETFDGSQGLVKRDQWVFTAIAGGGPIADMGDVPPIGLYIGPPWPSSRRPGTYFDTPSGDLGYYRIGV